MCAKTHKFFLVVVFFFQQLHFVLVESSRPCAFLFNDQEKNKTEKLPNITDVNEIKDRVRNNSFQTLTHKKKKHLRNILSSGQCSLSLSKRWKQNTRDWDGHWDIVVYIHRLKALSAQFNYACCVLILCKWIFVVCIFGMLLWWQRRQQTGEKSRTKSERERLRPREGHRNIEIRVRLNHKMCTMIVQWPNN